MGSIGGTSVNSLGISNFSSKELDAELTEYHKKWWDKYGYSGSKEDANALIEFDVRRDKDKVDLISDYFKVKGITNILEPDPDYPQDIMWKFLGTNKWSGETKIYEIPGKASESEFKKELRRNGYSPNRDTVLPRHLYDALLKYSNFEDDMVRIARTMSKLATKKYRDSRRKK